MMRWMTAYLVNISVLSKRRMILCYPLVGYWEVQLAAIEGAGEQAQYTLSPVHQRYPLGYVQTSIACNFQIGIVPASALLARKNLHTYTTTHSAHNPCQFSCFACMPPLHARPNKICSCPGCTALQLLEHLFLNHINQRNIQSTKKN